MIELAYPHVTAVGAVLALAATWLALRDRDRAGLPHTRVDIARRLSATPRVWLGRLALPLRLAALLALAVACGRPQVAMFDERRVEGIDLMLALDMSGSMMAVDLHPNAIQRVQAETGREPGNRFDNAIATLQRFVAGRSRDRIGMVVFAREAFLQFPLTLDYATIQTLLSRLQLNAIDSSATAIGNALGLAVRGLLNSDAKSRAVILITDGKQQGGNISPTEAAATAATMGIRIYSILVGAEGMTMVPTNLVNLDGTRRYAQQHYPVDPALLQQLADTTGGRFYRAAQPEELERDLNAILDDLETTVMQDVSSTQRLDVFGPWLLAALALLLAESLVRWGFARRYA